MYTSRDDSSSSSSSSSKSSSSNEKAAAAEAPPMLPVTRKGSFSKGLPVVDVVPSSMDDVRPPTVAKGVVEDDIEEEEEEEIVQPPSALGGRGDDDDDDAWSSGRSSSSGEEEVSASSSEEEMEIVFEKEGGDDDEEDLQPLRDPVDDEDDDDGHQAPHDDEADTPHEFSESNRKRGLFGFGRRSKTPNDTEAESEVAVPKKKSSRGFFGSFGKASRTKDDEDDDDDESFDENANEAKFEEGTGGDATSPEDIKPARQASTGFFGAFIKSAPPDYDDSDDEQDKPPPPQRGKGFFGRWSSRNRALEQPDAQEEADVDIEDGHVAHTAPEESKGRRGFGWFGRPSKNTAPSTLGNVAEEEHGEEDVTESGAHEDKPRMTADAAPAETARRSGPSGGGGGVGCCTLILIFLLFALILVGATIGTAYLGYNLAVDNRIEPTPAPTMGGGGGLYTNVTARPCAYGDRLFEFTITFDSQPSKVGVNLQNQGSATASIWDFEPGTFRSFTQLQRDNRFQVCLNTFAPYSFRITSDDQTGLISEFIDQRIYGSWEMAYGGEVVASYNGDCAAKDRNFCGPYCVCEFILTQNATSGDCMSCDTPAPSPAQTAPLGGGSTSLPLPVTSPSPTPGTAIPPTGV